MFWGVAVHLVQSVTEAKLMNRVGVTQTRRLVVRWGGGGGVSAVLYIINFLSRTYV